MASAALSVVVPHAPLNFCSPSTSSQDSTLSSTSSMGSYSYHGEASPFTPNRTCSNVTSSPNDEDALNFPDPTPRRSSPTSLKRLPTAPFSSLSAMKESPTSHLKHSLHHVKKGMQKKACNGGKGGKKAGKAVPSAILASTLPLASSASWSTTTKTLKCAKRQKTPFLEDRGAPSTFKESETSPLPLHISQNSSDVFDNQIALHPWMFYSMRVTICDTSTPLSKPKVYNIPPFARSCMEHQTTGDGNTQSSFLRESYCVKNAESHNRSHSCFNSTLFDGQPATDADGLFPYSHKSNGSPSKSAMPSRKWKSLVYTKRESKTNKEDSLKCIAKSNERCGLTGVQPAVYKKHAYVSPDKELRIKGRFERMQRCVREASKDEVAGTNKFIFPDKSVQRYKSVAAGKRGRKKKVDKQLQAAQPVAKVIKPLKNTHGKHSACGSLCAEQYKESNDYLSYSKKSLKKEQSSMQHPDHTGSATAHSPVSGEGLEAYAGNTKKCTTPDALPKLYPRSLGITYPVGTVEDETNLVDLASRNVTHMFGNKEKKSRFYASKSGSIYKGVREKARLDEENAPLNTNGRRGSISRKSGVASTGTGGNTLYNDSPNGYARVPGVWYDSNRRLWRVMYINGDKRKTKGFSVRDSSYDEARRLAVEWKCEMMARNKNDRVDANKR